MVTSVMSSFRRTTEGGKPFNISIVQDEQAALMSEKDARLFAIELWSSIDYQKRLGLLYDRDLINAKPGLSGPRL